MSAIKSCMGHAEPAAGGVGIANLATMLSSYKKQSITSLRQACAYLTIFSSKNLAVYGLESLCVNIYCAHHECQISVSECALCGLVGVVALIISSTSLRCRYFMDEG